MRVEAVASVQNVNIKVNHICERQTTSNIQWSSNKILAAYKDLQVGAGHDRSVINYTEKRKLNYG